MKAWKIVTYVRVLLVAPFAVLFIAGCQTPAGVPGASTQPAVQGTPQFETKWQEKCSKPGFYVYKFYEGKTHLSVSRKSTVRRATVKVSLYNITGHKVIISAPSDEGHYDVEYRAKYYRKNEKGEVELSSEDSGELTSWRCKSYWQILPANEDNGWQPGEHAMRVTLEIPLAPLTELVDDYVDLELKLKWTYSTLPHIQWKGTEVTVKDRVYFEMPEADKK